MSFLLPIVSAVCCESPVTIFTWTPLRSNVCTDCSTPGRGGSRMPITPRNVSCWRLIPLAKPITERKTEKPFAWYIQNEPLEMVHTVSAQSSFEQYFIVDWNVDSSLQLLLILYSWVVCVKHSKPFRSWVKSSVVKIPRKPFEDISTTVLWILSTSLAVSMADFSSFE